MLYYSSPQIVLQEVPGEITLALSISGCPLSCKGCHSTHTKNKQYGTPLTKQELLNQLLQHNHITCVLFYGGEWESDYLLELLKLVQLKKLKTCLYTGRELEDVPKSLLQHLTFIKVGPYIEALGGLDSPTTNQRFITL